MSTLAYAGFFACVYAAFDKINYCIFKDLQHTGTAAPHQWWRAACEPSYPISLRFCAPCARSLCVGPFLDQHIFAAQRLRRGGGGGLRLICAFSIKNVEELLYLMKDTGAKLDALKTSVRIFSEKLDAYKAGPEKFSERLARSRPSGSSSARPSRSSSSTYGSARTGASSID